MSDGFDAARHTVLLGAVCRLPGPIFAVVDGSWFADLPRLLAGRGLAHRSLFWDGGEPELLSAGPWLVDLGGERLEAQERLLDIAENKPAVVFWSCPGGAAILHKHLRSINEVLVPNRPETSASHSALHRSDHGEDRVLFRHWDPRVLASVAPLLDEEQAARLFGPADGIALDSGYGRGPGSIMRPPALPIAPTGILRFSHEQLDALDDEQLSRFRWETVSYLRKHCHE